MQNQATTKCSTSQKSKAKSRSNKRQRNRRKKKEKRCSLQQNKPLPPSHPTPGPSTKRSGADIWREAYENSIRWHAEHQGNYWRQMALRLENENQKLQSDLEELRSSAQSNGYEANRETSNHRASCQDDSDDLDCGYLEFLEITIQHQKETRMRRQLEI